MSVLDGQTSVAVCVVGVPGVGKSTLLARYAEAHPGEARHVVGSSIVKAVIAPDSVRDLDGYPLTRQEAVRAEAIDRLRRVRDEVPGFLLVDGHITLRSRANGQLQRVFTTADETFYDAIVLLTSTPELVLSQRARDTRSREPESHDAIQEHLRAERAGAEEVCKRASLPLLLIEAEGLENRMQSMAQFLRGLRHAEGSVP